MLHFRFVTKITTFNITKYINIKPKLPIINYRGALPKGVEKWKFLSEERNA